MTDQMSRVPNTIEEPTLAPVWLAVAGSDAPPPRQHMHQRALAAPLETIPQSENAETASGGLGLLSELAGKWEGEGLNLIARPDFKGGANLYMQINQTRETLEMTRVSSPIPHHGFTEDNLELRGLTYLDTVTDASTGSVLHVEPGMWTTKTPRDRSPQSQESPQIVARMASVPHGNALVAQGTATSFDGEFPTLRSSAAEYSGSTFPSFNSTPFRAVRAPRSPRINAAGSSVRLTAAALATPAPPFSQYDLSIPESPANPRTPLGSDSPEQALPTDISGVPMQNVINDPIALLQAVIQRQRAEGHTFSGVVINIATQRHLTFLTVKNAPTGPRTSVTVVGGAGGIQNSPVGNAGEPTRPDGLVAEPALVYSTFWIELVDSPIHGRFMQMQYAQMTVLNFEILKFLPAKHENLGWPHISVATLTKAG